LQSTIKNLPGLWRLWQRELNLVKDFQRDYKSIFRPILTKLEEQSASELSPPEIIDRVETILDILEKATYYSILTPISLAFRQAIFQVKAEDLDNSHTPEVESMVSLANLAADTRKLLAAEEITMNSSASLFAHIAENPEGASILERFNQWLKRYGYLSNVATDIAVPRWQDNPRPIRETFAQFFFDGEKRKQAKSLGNQSSISWQTKIVQLRLNLKGQVTEVYSQLLAHLRWSFVALAQDWLKNKVLETEDHIFFLNLLEIRRLIINSERELLAKLPELIQQRQQKLEQNQKLTSVPYIVYGNAIPLGSFSPVNILSSSPILKGIGASAGQVEGVVKVIGNIEQISQIDSENIVVVPYTDSGWSPIFTRAKGLIAEVGGRLSHGAIVAREYGIPAIMNIPNVTQLLRDGQRVRIDGQTGIVEILEN
jgi:pyruvate,water dikinase